jgi:hypothetical protein
MADRDTKLKSRIRTASLTPSRGTFGLALAGAVAAGTGLFLWSRGRGAQAEESTADEVQAHPS